MRSAFFLLAVAAGCHGGWHVAGEKQAIALASAGVPAGDFIFAGTDADAPCVGVGAGLGIFPADRIAVLGTGTYRYYDQDNGPVNVFEYQAIGRYYFPIEFKLGSTPVGVFGDVAVGVLHGSRTIPEDGSHTNISGEAGGGIEFLLDEKVSLLAGYHARHISNGGGNVPDNPGYNDHQFFLGFGWRW